MGWKSACMGIMLGYNGHEQLFEGFRTTSTSYRYRVVWKIYHEVQKTNEVHPYWYIHERFPVYMHNYMVPIDICVVLFQGSLHILVGNKASVQTLTGGGIQYMEPCDHSHYRDKGGWFLQITLRCTTWDHAHTSPALCIVHELLIVCYIVEISFANTSTHFLPPSTCSLPRSGKDDQKDEELSKFVIWRFQHPLCEIDKSQTSSRESPNHLILDKCNGYNC